MRNSLLVISTLISFLGLAVPANAQIVADTSQGVSSDNGPAAKPEPPAKSGPSILGYVGFGSSYIYQDFGFSASKSPVIYGGTTFTWDSGDSLDAWFSKGAGDSANEIDLSYWHNGQFDSPIGPITYQAKVAYYFLSGGGRNHLLNPVDDAGYSHLDLVRTFDFGRLSIGLHSKTELIDGINNVPFFGIERVGVPVDYKVSDTLSSEIEFAHAWNFTGNGKNPWELTPKAVWTPNGGTSFILKDKTDYVKRHMIHEVMVEVDIPLN